MSLFLSSLSFMKHLKIKLLKELGHVVIKQQKRNNIHVHIKYNRGTQMDFNDH
jgi:hypothetical protein